jgi:arginase
MTAIRLIGVPMDLGASRRGVDMGPYAVRYTDLRERLEALGHSVDDLGNVSVPFREDAEKGAQRGARYLGAITSVCRDVAGLTRTALEQDRFPILLGGDHSLAAGSIAGAASYHAARNERVGVIWIDAHADLNTPGSSRSGNVHGMPLAHLLGHGDTALAAVGGIKPAVRPNNVAIVGLRDADEAEREHIEKWKLRALTMRAIDERGVRSVMEEAIAIASDGTAGIWVSFDLDCLTPEAAPGVGTAVPGGMTYREAHLAMEMLFDTGRVIGIDLVEVNPVLDQYNRTAGVATDLLLSALGKRIL